MRGGRRIAPDPPLGEVRERVRASRASLPPALRSLRPGGGSYPVEPSARLRELAAEADRVAFRNRPGRRVS